MNVLTYSLFAPAAAFGLHRFYNAARLVDVKQLRRQVLPGQANLLRSAISFKEVVSPSIYTWTKTETRNRDHSCNELDFPMRRLAMCGAFPVDLLGQDVAGDLRLGKNVPSVVF